VVSGFGPKAAALAGRIGDGYACTGPAADLVDAFNEAGGAGKPTQAGVKVCYGEDEAAARALAHELWAQSGVPGELNQELPTPAHFEQAVELVTEDLVAESITCGNDPERFVQTIKEYEAAGFSHVYLQQVGPDLAGFLDFYRSEVEPRL
jgi:G6PDH family F420-dependent oxidoreductase